MNSLSIHPVPLRVILLLALAASLGWLGWMQARAALGNGYSTFVERNPNLASEERLQGVDKAVAYAPHDPLVRWQRGENYLKAATEDQAETHLPTAIAELRAATRLSPNDYRLWLALGRALERSGNPDEARGALEQAVVLAPNHFDPQWNLGNHLLRTGQADAAFAALRVALQRRPAAMPLIFDYAWNAYNGDSAAVIRALADTSATRVELAALLGTRNRVDDALQLWRASGPHTPADTRKLAEAFATAGKFKAAYELWRAANDGVLPTPDAGSLLANGGFEQNFDPASSLPLLAWHSTPGRTVGVTLDQQTHAAGQLSLRFRFDQLENLTLVLAAQTAPVKPNANYCLSFAARTEALQSLSTPLVSVTDAGDDKRLSAATPQLPNGTNDWTTTVLRFATKAETEAVTVRVLRLPCAEPPCPLTGRLWLDDFKLAECAK